MWNYKGDPSRGFLPGVPQRDISDTEANDRGLVQELEASTDYEHVTDAAPMRGRRAQEGADE